MTFEEATLHLPLSFGQREKRTDQCFAKHPFPKNELESNPSQSKWHHCVYLLKCFLQFSLSNTHGFAAIGVFFAPNPYHAKTRHRQKQPLYILLLQCRVNQDTVCRSSCSDTPDAIIFLQEGIQLFRSLILHLPCAFVFLELNHMKLGASIISTFLSVMASIHNLFCYVPSV